MKNTFKIIGFHETCGDKFFNVAITDKQGDTHTDLLSEVTLMKFAQAMERKNEKFEIDEENEELVNELSQLGFIEIAEEEEDGKEVFDVYVHKFFADDVLSYNVAGEYVKTYKTEKGARNFAAKQRYIILD